MAPPPRTYLRIEGDLVSLVSEVTDREIGLADLLAELSQSQVVATPILPIGCRYWLRSGLAGRHVYVVEQAPTRRTITYHASRRSGADPVRYRLAFPYVVFVVAVADGRIDGLATYFRTEPLGSLDATLCHSTLPNTSDDGVVCLGSVRVTEASVGERIEALLAAYWASRFNQDLRRHPLPFGGGFRAWASRSRRDPLAALAVRYDPYWRTLRQVVASLAGLAAADLPASPVEPAAELAAEVATPAPVAIGEEAADDAAS